MVVAKKFVLRKRFEGEPKPSDVTLIKEELKPLEDKEILVEAEYLSVDPYMRPFSYRIPLGGTMVGSQVAKIIESKNPRWPVGMRIVALIGWRSHTVFNPDIPAKCEMITHKTYSLPDFGDLPPSLGLGILGMTGNTAYFGFLEICKPQPGETVVISGAAGAVGSHVGQIAKILDMKVIGITDSDSKCQWLVDELGFDHAINYKIENVAIVLKKAAPEGIDCYFDNVGGEISAIVIHQMKDYGRISVSGCISCYNDGDIAQLDVLPKTTTLLPSFVFRQLTMEGFFVTRWTDQWFEGIEKNLTWIREGKLRYKETITEGFDNMFDAFVGMMNGTNIGKAIVKA